MRLRGERARRGQTDGREEKAKPVERGWCGGEGGSREGVRELRFRSPRPSCDVTLGSDLIVEPGRIIPRCGARPRGWARPEGGRGEWRVASPDLESMVRAEMRCRERSGLGAVACSSLHQLSC